MFEEKFLKLSKIILKSLTSCGGGAAYKRKASPIRKQENANGTMFFGTFFKKSTGEKQGGKTLDRGNKIDVSLAPYGIIAKVVFSKFQVIINNKYEKLKIKFIVI